MLMKLSCGYEINPDRIEVIDIMAGNIAHIGPFRLKLTDDEYATIRAYLTKNSVEDRLERQIDKINDSADLLYKNPPKMPPRTPVLFKMPKMEFNEEQKAMNVIVGQKVASISAAKNLYCTMCKNNGSELCLGCIHIDIDNAKLTLNSFSIQDGIVPVADCSGAQHEKQEDRRCSTCNWGMTPFSGPCVNLCKQLSHWEPRFPNEGAK